MLNSLHLNGTKLKKVTKNYNIFLGAKETGLIIEITNGLRRHKSITAKCLQQTNQIYDKT